MTLPSAWSQKSLYNLDFAAFKSRAQLCQAIINSFPVAWLPFDIMPVIIEAAAKSLYDLCDFVKQLHQHGVPVSTSRTDAVWVLELHYKVGAPVIKLIKHAPTSAAPQNPSKRALHSAERRLAGFWSVLLRMCCGKLPPGRQRVVEKKKGID